MYKQIADECCVEIVTVKKWFQNKNPTTPSEIGIVHRVEAFLGTIVGKPVDLLTPITTMEGKMKYSISDSEKNCARELYSCLLNTIDRAVPDYRYVLKNKPGALDFISSISESRYEAIMAVKKTAFDLPESLRSAAITLIEDAYGPESDEPGAFFNTEDYKAFIASEEYQQYVSENCPAGSDREMDHLNYCEAKREELFFRLDDIFSIYICK